MDEASPTSSRPSPSRASTGEPWSPENRTGVAPLYYECGVYDDPLSGMKVPKTFEQNRLWRIEILNRCEDYEYAAEIARMCQLSPVLFFNLFLWTYKFRSVLPDGQSISTPGPQRHQPFITWPCQDREILRITRAINQGINIWGIKSRDMGWTWLVCGLIVWYTVLHGDFHSLMISRKEEEVDRKNDPDTLYWKVRYMMSGERMPSWLLGKFDDSERNIFNPATGSSIAGESTNQDVGKSGRRDLAFVDEAGAISMLDMIVMGLMDTVTSMLLVSTPKAGSYFNRMVSMPGWEHAQMAWYEHPEKGAGRVFARRDDPLWNELVSNPVYSRHRCFDNRDGFWTSAWHQRQMAERSPRDMSENVEMDLAGAGDMVFPPDEVARAQDLYQCAATYRGEIFFAHTVTESGMGSPTVEPEELYEGDKRLKRRDHREIRWVDSGAGRWKLFVEIERDHNNILRPPQDRMYVIGADPGDGRRGANGTIAIYDDKGEHCASWTSSNYSARDQARMMVAAATWFGGLSHPLLIWETNGVGGSMTSTLDVKLAYVRLFQRRRENVRVKSLKPELGWGSSATTKRILLDDFGDAVSKGDMRPKEREVYEEMGVFIINDKGRVCQSTHADLKSEAMEAHGDRVVAHALCWLGIREFPRSLQKKRMEHAARKNPDTPAGMMYQDMLEEQERELRNRGWRYSLDEVL